MLFQTFLLLLHVLHLTRHLFLLTFQALIFHLDSDDGILCLTFCFQNSLVLVDTLTPFLTWQHGNVVTTFQTVLMSNLIVVVSVHLVVGFAYGIFVLAPYTCIRYTFLFPPFDFCSYEARADFFRQLLPLLMGEYLRLVI